MLVRSYLISFISDVKKHSPVGVAGFSDIPHGILGNRSNKHGSDYHRKEHDLSSLKFAGPAKIYNKALNECVGQGCCHKLESNCELVNYSKRGQNFIIVFDSFIFSNQSLTRPGRNKTQEI